METKRYNLLKCYLTDWTFPEDTTEEERKKLKGQAIHFLVKNQRLFKKNRKNPETPLRVVQKDEVSSLLKRLHEDPLSGHFGINNTYHRAQERYYWPQMFHDVRQFVTRCDTCQKRKKVPHLEEMHPLPVGKPFDRIGIDLAGPLPLTKNGSRYLAVATDYLTKWVETRAIPDKTAASVAGFIYEDVICRHGAPKELLSDQGTKFLNQLVNHICDQFGTTHRITTPYHPQTNGLTERFNRTIANALAKLLHEHPDYEWDELVPTVTFAYRTMSQSTTKQTPFFLLYGREATLPLEFSLPTHNLRPEKRNSTEESQDLQQRVHLIKNRLQQAQDLAQQKIRTAQELYKQRHDNHVQNVPRFQIGEQVLRHRAELINSKSVKLELKYEGPYYIHEVYPGGIYKLRRPSGKKLAKKIHGNHLKKYLPPQKPTPYVEVTQWPKH